MHDNELLLNAINEAVYEAENLSRNSNSFKLDIEPLQSTYIVLCNLKRQLNENGGQLSVGILRGMHDIGVASYRSFENTLLEKAIDRVIEILYRSVDTYKNLKPLRKEFDLFISKLPRCL